MWMIRTKNTFCPMPKAECARLERRYRVALIDIAAMALVLFALPVGGLVQGIAAGVLALAAAGLTVDHYSGKQPILTGEA
ncbi:MAG: hypothetical protein JWR10_1930 [Rubritepida sp.]|nr:hypothetical protein [Rubritepida sp.]